MFECLINFFIAPLGDPEIVDRIIGEQRILRQKAHYGCGVVGVGERFVEGNVFLNMQHIHGVLQRAAAFSVLKGEAENFLDVIKFQREGKKPGSLW